MFLSILSHVSRNWPVTDSQKQRKVPEAIIERGPRSCPTCACLHFLAAFHCLSAAKRRPSSRKRFQAGFRGLSSKSMQRTGLLSCVEDLAALCSTFSDKHRAEYCRTNVSHTRRRVYKHIWWNSTPLCLLCVLCYCTEDSWLHNNKWMKNFLWRSAFL